MTQTYKKKIFVVILCQFVMAIGGSFLFCSNMGNDPFGVFCDGVSKLLNVSYGTSNFILSVLIVVVCLLFHKKNISFTTILTAVIPGLVLDFYIFVIQNLAVPQFVVKYVYPFVGCFIIGTFVACYLAMNTGASCIDNMVLWIADGIKKDYRAGYFLFSISLLILGIPLGGVFGYATFVTFFCTGNVVKLMTPFFEKTVAVWANS